MENLTLLMILSGIGILCALAFLVYLRYLIAHRKDLLNRIVLIYIGIGIVSCVIYGLAHNILVNPRIFNSLIALDFSYPQIQAFFITWTYRALIYFLVFALWLRTILKRALHWKDKTRVFGLLILHSVLISTAWFTDFEKLLYYGGKADLHHFLHWLGGIIGCTMVLLMEFVFMEKKVIAFLDIKGSFQSLRSRLLFLFLGIAVIMLLAIVGILAGCLGIDPPGTIIAKVLIYACFFLVPLVYIIIRVTGDFHKSLSAAARFLEQAGNLDFTFPVEVASNDEFGQLGQSLFALRENLRSVLLAIKQSALEVDASAGKIDAALAGLIKQSDGFLAGLKGGMEERTRASAEALLSLRDVSARVEAIADRASLQTSSAENNLGLLTDMRSSFTGVDARADEATTIARNLFAVAGEGKESIQQTLDGVVAVATLAEKIREVIGVIDSITEETKILAINAKIEAARAGATGRGFGVVAGQMSLLAENTGRNAESISSHIKDIYARVNASLADMKKSRDGYLVVHEQAEHSRDISQVIATDMDENARLLSDIFDASRKLTEVSREVVRFTEELKGSSAQIQDTFTALQKAATEESGNLRENARFMQQVIDAMRNAIRANTGIAEKLKDQAARFTIEE